MKKEKLFAMIAVIAMLLLSINVNAQDKNAPAKIKGQPLILNGVPKHKTYAIYPKSGVMTVSRTGIFINNGNNKIYFINQFTGEESLVVDGHGVPKGYSRDIERLYSVDGQIIVALGRNPKHPYDTEYKTYYATWDGINPGNIVPIPDALQIYDFDDSNRYIWFGGANNRLFRYDLRTGNREYLAENEGVSEGHMTAEGKFVSGHSDAEEVELNRLDFWKNDPDKATSVNVPGIPYNEHCMRGVLFHAPVDGTVFMSYYRSIYKYPWSPILKDWEPCRMPDNCPGQIAEFIYNPNSHDLLAHIDNTIDGDYSHSHYMLLFKNGKNTAHPEVFAFPYEIELEIDEKKESMPFTTIAFWSFEPEDLAVDKYGNYIIADAGRIVVYNPYGVNGYMEGVNRNPKPSGK